MNKNKILVIDDDEAILEAITLALTEAEFNVKSLGDGKIALQTAEEFDPDLILIDYYLAGSQDGIAIAKQIKENTKTKRALIIMLSAHPSATHLTNTPDIVEFIPKPFDIIELIDNIQKKLS